MIGLGSAVQPRWNGGLAALDPRHSRVGSAAQPRWIRGAAVPPALGRWALAWRCVSLIARHRCYELAGGASGALPIHRGYDAGTPRIRRRYAADTTQIRRARAADTTRIRRGSHRRSAAARLQICARMTPSLP